MTSEKHDPVLYVLVTGLLMFAAAFAFVACGGGSSSDGGVVEQPTTTTMSFQACQKSAEYPGGRYAVEYDKGVCTVQKPAAAPTTVTTAEDLSFSSCAEAKAKGYSAMRRGEAGYSKGLDRDGDGIACDS